MTPSPFKDDTQSVGCQSIDSITTTTPSALFFCCTRNIKSINATRFPLQEEKHYFVSVAPKTFALFLLSLNMRHLIVWLTVLSSCRSAVNKQNPDGSVSSHSGRASPVERLLTNFSRKARASFFIDPAPRLIYSMPVPADWAAYIVSEHNRVRKLIPASDMQEIAWDANLAVSAQRHADRCLFAHSDDRVNTGENIWAAPFSNYAGAVKLWFDEVYDKQCGCQNIFKECCGHYTQVVWADTNRVGCGLASCNNILNAPGHHYILVCHYTPVGNLIYVDETQFYGVPAFQYRTQNELPCTNCPAGTQCNDGLCGNRLKA